MEAIAKVIREGALPDEAREMLLKGLPHALEHGEPHAYQQEFGKLVSATLKEAKEAAAAELANCDSAKGGLEAELARLQAELHQATQEVEASATEVARREEERAALKEAVRAAEAEQQAAEAETSEPIEACEQLRVERSELTALADSFASFAEKGAGPDEVVSEVVGHLSDKALAAALPPAIRTPPGSRKPFDDVVLVEVQGTLKRKFDAVEASLAEALPKEKAARAEALGLWAIADCARDGLTEAAGLLSEAQKKHRAAQTAHKRAAKSVKEQEDAIAQHADEQQAKAVRVQEVDAAGAALEQLLAGGKAAAAGGTEAAAAAAPVEEATQG